MKDEEIGRWQKEIYALLIKESGASHKIDGAFCDSGDPLDFTLLEISQALDYLKDQVLIWHETSIITAPHGIPVWCWSDKWIDEDFNPEGVREGFYNDEGYWITCGWDACHDVYTTIEDEVPVKWAYRIKPRN